MVSGRVDAALDPQDPGRPRGRDGHTQPQDPPPQGVCPCTNPPRRRGPVNRRTRVRVRSLRDRGFGRSAGATRERDETGVSTSRATRPPRYSSKTSVLCGVDLCQVRNVVGGWCPVSPLKSPKI